MRTKLDEIVEAFFGTDEKPVFYPDGPRRAVMAAVEKAFRHGVERLARRHGYGEGLCCDVVQPAPAEEKHVCSYGCSLTGHGPPGDRRKAERRKVQWWRLKTEPIEFPAEIDCPVGVPYEKYPLPDRRKGERRKELEKRLEGIAKLGPALERKERLFCTTVTKGWGEWRDERRHNDRRKP